MVAQGVITDYLDTYYSHTSKQCDVFSDKLAIVLKGVPKIYKPRIFFLTIIIILGWSDFRHFFKMMDIIWESHQVKHFIIIMMLTGSRELTPRLLNHNDVAG